MWRIRDIVRRARVLLGQYWGWLRPRLSDRRVLIGVTAFFLGQVSTPLFAPAYRGFYATLTGWSQPVVVRIFGPAVELGGIGGVVYRLRGRSSLGEELFQDLRQIQARIEKELGPPLFKGQVEIRFDPGLDGDGEVSESQWLNRRYIRFPRSDVRPTPSLIAHELVHALWQTREFMENCPLAAVEGTAVAISQIVTKDQEALLLPGLENSYLTGLEGFIQPGYAFERPGTKQLEYALAGLFFKQLHQLDSTALPQILRRPPQTKMTWVEFVQQVVKLSAHPAEVRSFLGQCRLFSPLSAGFFAVPLRSETLSVINLALVTEDWEGKAEVTTLISLNGELYRLSRGVFFNSGLAELPLVLPGEGMPDKIVVEGRFLGNRFEQCILWERR